jgi:hypothetical protein
MSHHPNPADHSNHGHAPGKAPTNEDGVNIFSIVMVGVVSLIVFAVSVVVAGMLLKWDTGRLHDARGRATAGTQLGKAEIGIVDQVEFDLDRRVDVWRASNKKRLGSYGWVDRSKGVVHIPIDKAMEEVISQTAAAPAPGTEQ